LGSGLNWWYGLLMSEGKIVVNRAPVAGNKNYTRGWGLPLTIAISDLLAVCSDQDSGDAVVFQGVSNGTSGTTATNANYILYTPSANSSDTLVYTVRDNRGGTKTANINISLAVQQTSSAQSFVVSAGEVTAVFAALRNLHYAVERAAFSNGPWDVLTGYEDVVTDANSKITVSDTPPEEWSSAFYRLKWLGN
jgi:hypothetical protein